MNQGSESKWMSVELICYVKTIIVFYKFYEIFCRRHSFYNNLFQFMEYDNFQNLNWLIFTFLLIGNIYSPKLMSSDTVL